MNSLINLEYLESLRVEYQSMKVNDQFLLVSG